MISKPRILRLQQVMSLGLLLLDCLVILSGFGFRVLDFGFRVLDFGFRVLDFGFRVLGFGFRVPGFGVGVSRLRIRGVSLLEKFCVAKLP